MIQIESHAVCDRNTQRERVTLTIACWRNRVYVKRVSSRMYSTRRILGAAVRGVGGNEMCKWDRVGAERTCDPTLRRNGSPRLEHFSREDASPYYY